MANNHMGDLSHGKKIILEFNKLTKNYKKKINIQVVIVNNGSADETANQNTKIKSYQRPINKL